MENIKINTSQNVELSYHSAGLGLRILAVLLDTIFKYSYVVLLIIIYYNAVLKGLYDRSSYNHEEDFQILYAVVLLTLLPFMLYHLLCETFLNGQSFGKKIMKIKVVKLDGTQATFGSYLIRSVFRIIDDSIVGVITISVTKNSQRLGDIVAGTAVIELNKRIGIQDTILSKIDDRYKIVYGQVLLMTDQDANIIKEVLVFAESQEQEEHLKLLADKIKAKYGIVNANQSDEDFLRTLLDDYTHYQFEN